MADFIKFGQGIADFLTRKVGGFAGVKYKITHKELEELALQNEDVLNVLEELKLDRNAGTVIEVLSKAKSNYAIASIKIKNFRTVKLDGAYSQSEEKGKDVYKYHFSSKKHLYSGYKSMDEEVNNTTKIGTRKLTKISDEEIIELYKSGVSADEIAQRYRVSPTTISSKIPAELKRYNAQWSDAVNKRIIELYKQGYKIEEIAQMCKTSTWNVKQKIPYEMKMATQEAKKKKFHEDIITLYKNGLKPKQIAQELNIAGSTVRMHIQKFRKGGGKVKKISYKNEVLRLAQEGLSPSQIAKTLGVDRNVVYKFFPKDKLKGSTKVNEDVKKLIIELKNQGVSTAEIAKQLHLGENTINQYIPKNLKKELTVMTDEMRKKAIELRKEGYSTPEIAEELKIAKNSILACLPKEMRIRVHLPKEVRRNILAMYKSSMTPEEIAAKTKLSELEVKIIIRKALRPKKISKLPTKITPEIRQKVAELKKAGKLVSEIAKELDISEPTVSRLIPKELKPFKITKEMKKEIIKMRKEGYSALEIAEKLGISDSSVNNYLPAELKTGKTKYEDIYREKVIELREKGFSAYQIAHILDISDGSVFKLLPKEMKQGNLIITDNVRKQILKMRQEGKSIDEIGRKVDLSPYTVYKHLPEELKNIGFDIDTISEEDFYNAYMKGKTRVKICEILKITPSALDRLNRKFSVIPVKQVADEFKETSVRKYEQFNNDELKERFINVISSLYEKEKLNEHSETAIILDKITDEILGNEINFETREKFIKLIRSLDLFERNIISTTRFAKSEELAQLKTWANKSAKIDNLKEGLKYLTHNLLPQNEEFELAQLLGNYKIKGIDDPNIEILDGYVQKLTNTDNLTKECAQILRTETYKNATPELKLLADKYSISVLGKIDPETAGRYIRSLMALDNPKMETTYPKNFVKTVKETNLPKPLAARYLTTLDEWFENADLERSTLKEFCKKFDINENLGNKIIKEYVLNTYLKLDTKIMTKGDNGIEMESVFVTTAKDGVIGQFGFPDCTKWFTDFEDAMTIFIPPDAHRSGIKYMKNRGEYEVKISDESNRLLSSDKSLRFDIYKPTGLHTKKKNRN